MFGRIENGAHPFLRPSTSGTPSFSDSSELVAARVRRLVSSSSRRGTDPAQMPAVRARLKALGLESGMTALRPADGCHLDARGEERAA
ncbi:MAG: hypothetical protein M5R42_15255 [Rhodocyclaceae bacterium]|nr:hypothetical protein [Rhodocyclaceae bacterium]